VLAGDDEAASNGNDPARGVDLQRGRTEP
jgi:hypothetical protein